jgi:ubiquinone/menaquinone biosynthesis C-methylase UbiE
MKSNQEWKQWGKADPLFAVSTWQGRDKGGNNPWTDEEFYALGQSDWSDFYTQWKQYGCDTRHCIEIGCGAGRLTKFIATAFELVSALDVSEDQIQYARDRVGQQNISYMVTDGKQLSSVQSPVTAIFSAHVFQHFDTFSDTETVLREVYRKLAPGGTIMIHLPIYNLPDSLIKTVLNLLVVFTKQVGTIKASFNRIQNKLIMRGLTVERSQLVNCLEELGFQDIAFRTFRVRSNGSWHDFVFAQKATIAVTH